MTPAVPRPQRQPRIARLLPTYFRLIALFTLAALWLIAAGPAAAAGSVPTGAKEALAPVTKMITTLVAIAIGLGVAICGAVIVWGGIEKTMAGANQDAESRASRRIQNGIHGLLWMILASVVVSTITAIAVAYGLIERPF